jgi:hypothetical protein
MIQVSILYECSLLIEWCTRFDCYLMCDLYRCVNHMTHVNLMRSNYLTIYLIDKIFCSHTAVALKKMNVEVLNTVTVWIQIYTYTSANSSMILQSFLLFFYITSIFRWFESYQVILWSHFLSSWSCNLINLVFIDRFNQLS